jgi:hypothetical protein
MVEAYQLGLPTPSELGSKLLQLMRKVHSAVQLSLAHLRPNSPWPNVPTSNPHALAEVKRRDQELGSSQRISPPPPFSP